MEKKLTIYLVIGIISVLFWTCKAPVPGPDLVKNWKADVVKENGLVVYQQGSASNIYPGYSKFKMSFGISKIDFTEFTGELFTGVWELSADNQKLTFSGLNPAPYGNEGVIEFTLISWHANRLVLKRDTPNPKTGNSSNEYTLIPQ